MWKETEGPIFTLNHFADTIDPKYTLIASHTVHEPSSQLV